MSTLAIVDVKSAPPCGLTLAAVVGFVFSFRISITFLWFQAEPQQGSVVTVTLSILLLVTACWIALVNPAKGSHDPVMTPTVKAAIAYLTLSGISLLWSSTRSIPIAAGYLAGTAADVFTLLLLLRYPPGERRIERVLEGYVVGAAVIALIAWSTPAMYDLRLGDWEFFHPNAIGFVTAIAALCAIYLAKVHKFWMWAAVGLSVTLLRTLSKGSIVAFLLAAVLYLCHWDKVGRRAKLTIALAAVITVILFWGLIESYSTFYSAGTSNIETLTGRTIIWSQSLEIASEAPWLGHGFYSYRFVVPPFGEFEAWHAHNELLQQYFSYGLVGVVLTIILYYRFYLQIRRGNGDALRALSAALLLFALVRGTVDTERFDLSCPLWLMAMLSVALFPRQEAPSDL